MYLNCFDRGVNHATRPPRPGASSRDQLLPGQSRQQRRHRARQESKLVGWAENNLQVALKWAAEGVAVFPCIAFGQRAKAPNSACCPNGFHDATTEPSVLRQWFYQSPQSLIGLRLDGFVAVDVDVDAGKSVDGFQELARLGLNTPKSAVILSQTPRGGLHIIFRWWPSVAIATRKDSIAKGIDIRGVDRIGTATGYIIAPGTQLPDGREYRLISGSLKDCEKPPLRWMWALVFDTKERQIIKRSPDLKQALSAVRDDPTKWRAVFDRHQKRKQDEQRRRMQASLSTQEIGAGFAAQARYDLNAEVARLSGLIDGQGRTCELFRASCRLGKYVANNVVSRDVFFGELLAAASTNGTVRDHGRKCAEAQITNGLQKAINDPLPLLARQFREGCHA